MTSSRPSRPSYPLSQSQLLCSLSLSLSFRPLSCSLKQHGDAAALYKAAELWDKAAGLFMQSKNFAAAGALMDKVTAPRLHATYAKVRGMELQTCSQLCSGFNSPLAPAARA